MRLEPCTAETAADWLALRQALWPGAAEDEHRVEITSILNRPDRASAFLVREAGAAIGFAEVTLRQDYVCGCANSPVAFLEGIYVHPDWRRRGVARLLCDAVERWAMGLGYSELASNAELENTASHRMHEALGFAETERVVYFHKRLPPE